MAEQLTNEISKNSMFTVNISDIETTKSEKITARRILEVFRLIQREYPNLDLVKKTKKSIGNKPIFQPYKLWLTFVEDVLVEGEINKFVALCKNTPTFQYANLNQQSKQLCLYKAISLFRKNHDSKILFTFVKQNFDQYYYKSAQKYLISFLIDSKGTKIHKKFTHFIESKIIDNNLSPNLKIINKLSFSPDLTRYIQIKGINIQSTESIFRNELRKIASKVLLQADEGKNKRIIYKETKKFYNFYSLNFDHINIYFGNKKLLAFGKSLIRRGYYNSGRYILGKAENNWNQDYREKVQFEYLWSFIVNNQYKKANNYIKSKKLLKNFDTIVSSKLQYWIADIVVNAESKSKSNKLFKRIINNNPLSFYSIIASKRIKENTSKNENLHKQMLFTNKFKYKNFEILPAIIQNSLKRLSLWGDIHHSSFIEHEYSYLSALYNKNVMIQKTFSSSSEYDRFVNYTSSKIMHNSENYLGSFKFLYRGLNKNHVSMNQEVLDILYPKLFWKNLNKVVKNIDPFVLLSLIRQESAFNTNAKSRVGARGLMQLMPATARTLQRRVKNSQLNNPQTNIKLGHKYLKYLLDKYDNNLVYALSAYNAGESRLKRWKKDVFTKDSLIHNIESIPFRETRKYVKLIIRNIYFYKLLENSDLKDPFIKNKIYDVKIGFKH